MTIKPGSLIIIKPGVKFHAWVEPKSFHTRVNVLDGPEIFLYLSDEGESVNSYNPWLPVRTHKVLWCDRVIWLQCATNDLVILEKP